MTKLEDLIERKGSIALGGGQARIDKQHEQGKMTARERLETLFDPNTFVEIDAFVVHRCYYFGQEKQHFPGDGVVGGYGKVDGRIVYAKTEFARLARCQGEVLHLMQVRHLPDYLARSLERHVEFVWRTGTEFSDQEDMLVEGKLVHLNVQCLPFAAEDGASGTVVVVYRDITAHVEAEQRLATMLRQTVEAFTHAVEAVDPYLKGQSGLTGELAYHLAAWLGKDDPALESTLRTAASLSQVGMIRLPHELLTKAGPLTPEERLLMEKHVDYAVEALRGIDFGLPVLQTIEQMHERMDGSGYPRKLQGEAICLQARILAVANTFCALMRPRSYRRRHDEPAALAILRERPFKYDQQVVDALAAFLQSAQGKEFVRILQQ